MRIAPLRSEKAAQRMEPRAQSARVSGEALTVDLVAGLSKAEQACAAAVPETGTRLTRWPLPSSI